MGVIDVHVHLAALPTATNGCLLSPRMRRSPLTRAVAYFQNLPMDDPETANRRYLEKLDGELAASEAVERAVLLGMDGVYDERGELDEKRTDFLISNDQVLASAASHPRFLAGVSINPQRKDAIEELERCAEKGAALVKALPNAQAFNPANKKYLPFFRHLGELGLPFLSHMGYEFSLIGQDQSVGDPDRLAPALEEGAAVIAAHGCSNGLFLYEKHFETMLALAAKYERFYIDVSALTLPNRVGALLKIRRRPEIFERLLFGTDYPLPCFSYPALAGLSWSAYRWVRAATNRFDRQHRVLEALGISAGADFMPLIKGS